MEYRSAPFEVESASVAHAWNTSELRMEFSGIETLYTSASKIGGLSFRSTTSMKISDELEREGLPASSAITENV